MTSEQIAELREMLRTENMPVWGTTDGRVETWRTTPEAGKRVTQALRALPRLLDEREALLEALKELSRRASDPDLYRRVGASWLMLDGAIKEADAVLAKAETP